MLSKYIHDKSPQMFRPRVTPDPDIQLRLSEKIKEIIEQHRNALIKKTRREQLNS